MATTKFFRVYKNKGTLVNAKTICSISELKRVLSVYGENYYFSFVYERGSVKGVTQDGFCAPAKHTALPYEMNCDLSRFSVGTKYVSDLNNGHAFEIVGDVKIEIYEN